MKKILLIEDNHELRENTAEILELANYQVVTAENGKRGAELALQEKPDVIVCDIMMPELDGYGVLHILGKNPQTAGIPFIFLTAKTEKADIRKGMNLGADDYLTKPFDDTELLNAIEVRLKKSSLRNREYDLSSEGLDNFIQDARHALKLEDLCKDKKIKSVKKKSLLFSEGDSPLNIFFIKKGTVKIFKSHAEGKELILSMQKAGDFFGFESILENRQYEESAEAMEDTEIITIPRHDFLTLINGHPDVSLSFIKMLSKKVSDKEKQLLGLAYNTVRQRTAETILKISGIKGTEEKISISREDLAKMVGTAPESVIRVLSDFKEEGLIEIESGKIKIQKPDKLEKIIRWNVAR
jgi:CRP-like cAMP-binding protein/CheY-like chemotaxis protein